MRINNNIMAMNTHRQYTGNVNSVAKSTEKLSSGYRINRAGDDAAGLAISEKMRAQIRGLKMASKNSQDAISLVQTAEGALQETHNILQRMRELAVQSSSDTNETSIDRAALQAEFKQLIDELDSTAQTTRFNDMGLIDGSYAENLTTASSTNAGYAVSWAATSTAAGTYTISTSEVTVKPQVAEVANSFSATAITVSMLNQGTTGVTATYVTGSASNGAINGNWSFTIANGKITASNAETGEKRTQALSGVAGSATVTVDFGDIGKIAFTNGDNKAYNASDFSNVEATITVKDGVTAQDAVKEYYLNINGEAAQVKQGQTSVVFNNQGLSFKLAAGVDLTSEASISATFLALTADINVNKSSNAPMTIQTGANQYDELAISIEKMDAQTLGVAHASIENRLNASNAITQVNNALNAVSTQRAALGALQNRLNHKINNLDTSAENLSAAESRIRDLDMAQEMTNYTRNNIMVQAATAMLAQANAAPQGVLQLLQ